MPYGPFHRLQGEFSMKSGRCDRHYGSAGIQCIALRRQLDRGGGWGNIVLSRSTVFSVALVIFVIGLGGGASAVSQNGLLTFVEAHFDLSEGGDIDGLSQPQGVVVSPDGRHVYVATENDDSLLAFSRDTETGRVELIEVEFDGTNGVDGLERARQVVISPDGKHLYVAAETDDAVSVFSRDRATGEVAFVEAELDGVGTVPNDALEAALGVAISPDGGHVYVASSQGDSVAVFSRDAGTGELTFVEAEFDGVGNVEGLNAATAVVVSHDGEDVYVGSTTGNSLVQFSRNGATGALTFVERTQMGGPDFDGLGAPNAVAISPDGRTIYTADGGGVDQGVAVFARSLADGSVSFVEGEVDGMAGVDGVGGASHVDVGPAGKVVFVSGRNDDALAVFGRDSSTGGLDLLETEFDGAGGVEGLVGTEWVAHSPDGSSVYVTGDGIDSLAVFDAERLRFFLSDSAPTTSEANAVD